MRNRLYKRLPFEIRCLLDVTMLYDKNKIVESYRFASAGNVNNILTTVTVFTMTVVCAKQLD